MSKFKHKYDYSEEESSESDDGDDSLLKEVDYLVRDCMLTTTTTTTTATNSRKNNVGISPTGEDNVGISATDDDEEEDDDFKLCQNIKRLCGDSEPLCLEPLRTLPPYASDEDDDEDDFETFADIQRRYGNRNDQVSYEETTTSANDDGYNDGVGGGDGFGGEFANEEYNEEGEEGEYSRSGGFPKSALMLLEAIKKNRGCQKLIKEKMQHMETVIEKNAKFRKVVKAVKDYHVKLKKDLGRAMSHKVCPQVLLISTHVQRNGSAMSYGPTDNSQVEWCKAALERFPVGFQRKKWSDQEKQDLRKGLVQQYQQMLFQEIADAADGSVGVDAVVSRVADCDVTQEIIQDFCFRGDVNWDRLALVSVPGRSGAECEAMWFNQENSLINKSKWTGEEDKKLLATILSKWTEDWSGIYDWSWIAAKLGTNRTPFQCCARYQRSLNASLLKREWTKAENAQLRSVVEDLGVSDWQAVASKLEGRTGTQCSDRWRKYLDPVITRVGKWSDKEDKRLKVAVKFLGKKWTSVAQFVPGRTDVQCRDRWENVLDPGLRWGEWTAEEDSKLEAAVLKFGYSSWSKVAACLGTRTDNQCWRRWKAVFPEQVAEARDARMLVKDALPSNFVGREAECPALGAKDFTPLLTAGQADEQNSHKALQKQKKSRKRGETVQKKSRNKGNTNQKKSRKSKITDDAAEDLGGSERGKSGKRKRSATSSEIRDTGERKKRKKANSGTKKNKRRGSRNTAPEYEEKSTESTETDEIRDLQSSKNKESDEATETDTSEWQIPKIRSRRSREIKVRGHYS